MVDDFCAAKLGFLRGNSELNLRDAREMVEVRDRRSAEFLALVKDASLNLAADWPHLPLAGKVEWLQSTGFECSEATFVQEASECMAPITIEYEYPFTLIPSVRAERHTRDVLIVVNGSGVLKAALAEGHGTKFRPRSLVTGEV